ncbi:hypothetical protein [Desulfobacula toluolica]|uniref:Uncharacterized protein n=1 Tax=Desulfobacula toluolica (strain DSM 7467 / Tol2) TaxID=651182 RepID=K0NIG6_DESTT|nr:hypothetical protein [Desulfobacula toluolica]CCK81196.1 uncharacterized protein TOL2_C30370 [Desulfobacula toluolica Tol2]
MPGKFRIYSTDISATLNPDSSSPVPATLIIFDQDPVFSEYNPAGSAQDRGSVIRTLGGVVIQDFGVSVQDGLISFSDTAALNQATVTALQSAYETIDGQWYFTDGYECWKVQFSRNPKGFRAWRNILYAYNNYTIFSYEINLIVISKEI